MATSPPSPISQPLPSSPPAPHPDSKISPAPAKHDKALSEERTVSPEPAGKLLWKDKLDLNEGRRPSIQFSTRQSEALLRSESPKPTAKVEKAKPGRKLSSPPPPPPHQSRVSFDTFANPDTPTSSFTLGSKHREYAFSSNGRTFLVGTDENDYSEYALQWLLEEMADDGDMVICLRVVPKESKAIPSSEIAKYRREAEKLLKHLQADVGARKINLVLEFATGKVQDNIMRMIELYEPNFLVVGTRGRNLNGIQGLLPGSVSKWCLQNSPIPVVVARKDSKRKKSKMARQADPNRRSYQALLKNDSATTKVLASHGHGPLSSENNLVPNSDGLPMTIENMTLYANKQTEAEAVAREIGIATEWSASTILKRRSSRASATSATSAGDSSDAGEGYALSRKVSTRSEDYGMESPSPTGPLRDESEGYFGDGESDADGRSRGRNDSVASTGSASAPATTLNVPDIRLQRTATDLDLQNKEA